MNRRTFIHTLTLAGVSLLLDPRFLLAQVGRTFIFVLFGPSNARGLKTVLKPIDKPIPVQAQVFYNGRKLKDFASQPGHAVGMERTFLQRLCGIYGLLQEGDRVVFIKAIIKCGTGLHDWWRPRRDKAGNILSIGGYYANMVLQIQAILKSLHLTGTQISALMAVIGENDAEFLKEALKWGQNMAELTADFRYRFNSPDCPLIYARTNYNKWHFNAEVHQQQELCAESLGEDGIVRPGLIPHARMVETSDLKVNPGDGVHFLPASQGEMGRRFYTKWEEE